ncbi:MAG: FAD-dependent oxidoreductase [bacterium]|nr:FAD-dependent oxidoreductase [bacterium]
MFDCIVIGAGLAGLSAAYELRNHDILVLEKDERAGGRVLTRTKNGVSYDLGAVFAIHQKDLPPEFGNFELIRETDNLGIHLDGSVSYGKTVMDCLKKLDLPEDDREIVETFRKDRSRDANALPKHIYKILNSFFQIVGRSGDG